MRIIKLRQEYKTYKTMCNAMGICPVSFEVWMGGVLNVCGN